MNLNWIKNLLFWIVLILINIIIIEGSLHIYYKVKHGFWMWDNPFALKNYVIPVKDSFQVYKLKPNYHSSCLNINKLGYRGEIIKEPKILALGDSVPFGAGVCDNETYSYFLNRKISTINGGVPSYTLQQSLRRWLNDFNFTNYYKIVTVQAANDVSLLTYFQDNWDKNSNWLKGYFENKPNPIFFYSSIVHYLKVVYDKLFVLKDKNKIKFELVSRKIENKFLKHIDNILNKFISEAKKRNKKLIFIPINPFYYMNNIEKSKKLKLWNNSFKQYIQLWTKYYFIINNLMKQKANNNQDVYYFDVVSKFDRVDRNLYYKDFIHHNKKGNGLFAKYLLQFIEEKDIFEETNK